MAALVHEARWDDRDTDYGVIVLRDIDLDEVEDGVRDERLLGVAGLVGLEPFGQFDTAESPVLCEVGSGIGWVCLPRTEQHEPAVIRMQEWDADPGIDGGSWDLVVELPYLALSRDLAHEWLIDGDGEESQLFSLGAAGSWRLRAHRLTGDYYSGDTAVPEQWLMQWWPAPVSRPQWLRRAGAYEGPAFAVNETTATADHTRATLWESGWLDLLPYAVRQFGLMLQPGIVTDSSLHDQDGGTASAPDLDESIWDTRPPPFPTGDAGYDTVEATSWRELSETQERERDRLASVAERFGTVLPDTYRDVLGFLVAAGVFERGDDAAAERQYVVPELVPRARDVVPDAFNLVRLDEHARVAHLAPLAGDVALLLAWTPDRTWQTDVATLAAATLSSPHDVESAIAFGEEQGVFVVARTSAPEIVLSLALHSSRDDDDSSAVLDEDVFDDDEAPAVDPDEWLRNLADIDWSTVEGADIAPVAAVSFSVGSRMWAGAGFGGSQFPTGGPAKAGVVMPDGRLVRPAGNGVETVETGDTSTYAAVETVGGTLLAGMSGVRLVRADGSMEAVAKAFHAMSLPVSPDGRYVALTGLRGRGRTVKWLVGRLDTADMSVELAPLAVGDVLNALGIDADAIWIRRTVRIMGNQGPPPGEIYRWALGGEPKLVPYDVASADSASGRTVHLEHRTRLTHVRSADGTLLASLAIGGRGTLAPGGASLLVFVPGAVMVHDVTGMEPPRRVPLPAYAEERTAVWEDRTHLLLPDYRETSCARVDIATGAIEHVGGLSVDDLSHGRVTPVQPILSG